MGKAIMFQGTASDVGKSVIVAGICRIFANRGQRVYPFKSQNMALNSYITRQGHEMGRAQVFQAEAARRLPEVAMNPVLIKPTSDTKSQIILMGKVLTNMNAAQYHDYKLTLRPAIQAIYQEILEDNDLVVIEGAGSPAEINLNDRDIVNMGMAQMADCPVILIADIDKGGVFASIYGTLALLKEEERARVKGIIINKFRGDIALLQPGLTMIQDLTGVPVIGIVPYFKLAIDEEDSVALSKVATQPDPTKAIDIAIISLGKISNFTDFNALSIHPDVSVRYVKDLHQLGNPDLIVLPGSKNTLEDLADLRERGLAQALVKKAEEGQRIIGICGGFQLLGQELRDPLGLESDLGSQVGLGLLPIHTQFMAEKHTYQSLLQAGDYELEGYEIHMGETTYLPGAKAFSLIKDRNGQEIDLPDGAVSGNGRILGTYLHGLFDNLAWTNDYLNQIRKEKGLDPMLPPDHSYADFKDQQYDLLAQYIEEALDMEALEAIMAQGGKG